MSTPGEYNFSIWRGDNAPPVIWILDIDLTGSTMQLEITRERDGCHETQTYTDGAGLTVTPGEAESSVEWDYSVEDSRWIPLGFRARYHLKRTVESGETRTYAYGTIIGR